MMIEPFTPYLPERPCISLAGTGLWFDVDGPVLVPDGSQMRQWPTVVLVHGGPRVYERSYSKPDFARLAGHAQVASSICAGMAGRRGATQAG